MSVKSGVHLLIEGTFAVFGTDLDGEQESHAGGDIQVGCWGKGGCWGVGWVCHKKSEALDLIQPMGRGSITFERLVFVDAFRSVRETQVFVEPKNRAAFSVVTLNLALVVTVSSVQFCTRGSWFITKHECFPIVGQ